MSCLINLLQKLYFIIQPVLCLGEDGWEGSVRLQCRGTLHGHGTHPALCHSTTVPLGVMLSLALSFPNHVCDSGIPPVLNRAECAVKSLSFPRTRHASAKYLVCL